MNTNDRNARLYEAMASQDDTAGNPIKRLLEIIRTHLNMDAAFLTRFDGDRVVFREVSAPGLEARYRAGASRAVSESYSYNVHLGVLPQLIPDTSQVPLALALPTSKEYTIGAFIGAPVAMPGGGVYGMFCCVSNTPVPTLNERDHGMLIAFAELASYEIERELAADRHTREALERVLCVLKDSDVTMMSMLQPIWDLSGGTAWGAEALCRIIAEPRRGPDLWFAEADQVSLREALEIAALKKSLSGLSVLSAEQVLSINVSPSTILTRDFARLIAELPLARIILELTEHLPVYDYGTLRSALAPLRKAGLRIAVDDAGGGYSSMTHILQLQPDIIKADMALTRDIDTDRAKQALMAALLGFAHATRATLLAEGIETPGEFARLRTLGVDLGQGYYLGRPAVPAEIDRAFGFGAGAFRPASVASLDAINGHLIPGISGLLPFRGDTAEVLQPTTWLV